MLRGSTMAYSYQYSMQSPNEVELGGGVTSTAMLLGSYLISSTNSSAVCDLNSRQNIFFSLTRASDSKHQSISERTAVFSHAAVAIVTITPPRGATEAEKLPVI